MEFDKLMPRFHQLSKDYETNNSSKVVIQLPVEPITTFSDWLDLYHQEYNVELSNHNHNLICMLRILSKKIYTNLPSSLLVHNIKHHKGDHRKASHSLQ